MDGAPTTIAVTGISGLIGRNLVQVLEADPSVEKILGIDIRDPASVTKKLVFVKRSVTEPFGEAFVEHQVDAAVHLAFSVDPIRCRADEEKVNVDGTRHFLAACTNAKVKTVLVLSSAAAYGARADNPPFLYEGAPLRASDDLPYARDKVRAEDLCYDFARANPTAQISIVRPCLVVGPNASNFVTRLLDRRVVLAPLGYDPPLQVVHEQDVARAVHELVTTSRVGVFNVAADGALTFSRMAELAGRTPLRLPRFLLRWIMALGWSFGLKSLSEAPPALLDYACYPWCVANTKLKGEVGFVFQHDALSAFLDFVEARQKAPKVRISLQDSSPAEAPPS